MLRLESTGRSPAFWNVLRVVLLAWFVVQAGFIAFNLKQHIAPDEPEHLQLSVQASLTPGFWLVDHPALATFGPTATTPPLFRT